MDDEIVSVVVPIYNMEKYLDKCIESIVKQTYKNLEIILVDDGSIDKSLKICNKWGEKDNRVNVYHKENGGLSDTKNFGIKHAKGKYISFIDADDWIELNMYEELTKEMIKTKSDIIICGRYLEYEDGKRTRQCNPNNICMNSEETIIKLDTFGGFDMSSCDKLYKTELFNGIEFPVGKKCEDAYVTYKLFAKSKKVEYYPKIFYHYLQRKNSISKNKKVNMDLIYASEEQIQFMEKNYPNLIEVSKINFVFSVKNLYEQCIVRKLKISNELQKYKNKVKCYTNVILKSKYLDKRHKIIFLLFNNFYYIYYALKKIKSIKSREKF